MPKTLFLAALLAAALSGTASARDRLPDVRVSYADLDLASAAGVATLDRRLARAAEAACPSRDGVREMTRLRTIALCRAAKAAEVAPLRAAAIARAAPAEVMAVAVR